MSLCRFSNFIRSRVSCVSAKRLVSFQSGEANPSKLHYLFLIAPVATFGLGTWQVFRLQWKERLVKEIKDKTTTEPVPLPDDLANLNEMNYCRIKVTGDFDHDRELYFGPRAVNRQTSGMGSNEGGYQIITPFKLARDGTWILINRGWVKKLKVDPNTRKEGQVDGTVSLNCIVRKSEKRGMFIPENVPIRNQWYFRDIEAMASHLGTMPVLLDADETTTVRGGPLGGQTKIAIRNEHLQYIITWYGLSIATLVLYLRLRKGSKMAAKKTYP